LLAAIGRAANARRHRVAAALIGEACARQSVGAYERTGRSNSEKKKAALWQQHGKLLD
jgi:hypothetical protein